MYILDCKNNHHFILVPYKIVISRHPSYSNDNQKVLMCMTVSFIGTCIKEH